MTFIGCLIHGVRQLRLFQALDEKTTTMNDFVALCVGLPTHRGSVRVEEQLQLRLSEALSQHVIGVSLCWDFQVEQQEVANAVKQELGLAEASRGSQVASIECQEAMKQ